MNKEVLIIGGGVIGLSIARELHKRGVRSIAVIDKGTCGSEASWAAAGMLGPQAEANEAGAFFDLCVRSRDLYPAFAGELYDETGIDVELDRTGTIYLAFSDEDLAMLEGRFLWQNAAGLAVEPLDASEVRRLEPFVSDDVLGALYFPGDWQVDNRKLCSALRRYCEIHGIEVVENTSVSGVIQNGAAVSGVRCGSDVFAADRVVAAAGAWTSKLVDGLNTAALEIEPVRGQMISFRTTERSFKHVIYSTDGYVVPRRDGRVLAGSTTEKVGYNTDTTDAAASALLTMACRIAPTLSNLGVEAHWSGLRPRASDGLPVIGGIEGIGGLLFATAHYRNGILLAPVTATLIADSIIEGQDSPDLHVFGPDRFGMKADRAGI